MIPLATSVTGTRSLLLVLVVASCAPRETSPADAAATDRSAVAAAPSPLPRDSTATIAAFERRAAQIDRDTLRFERIEQPIAIGAGTSGLLTAWRAGRIWQRLRVIGQGTAFSTRDTYWFSNGAFLGARLETLREGRRPTVDQVWFRDRALYRWSDPAGRHLDPHARSTQYETRMMQARLDSLLGMLASAELNHQRRR